MTHHQQGHVFQHDPPGSITSADTTMSSAPEHRKAAASADLDPKFDAMDITDDADGPEKDVSDVKTDPRDTTELADKEKTLRRVTTFLAIFLQLLFLAGLCIMAAGAFVFMALLTIIPCVRPAPNFHLAMWGMAALCVVNALVWHMLDQHIQARGKSKQDGGASISGHIRAGISGGHLGPH
ncbi:uncharacterized protein PV07_08691 [Cladophialophora immunda]|uniref:Uncharacterized protein n=1 Tax=Cladophialophora immunda TaxID=569365 RepID=A0A0D2C521_9EURO|nr:uncharacterized protein PV07_08691 [Cladophialophora immunda]KIW25525.1 hypothetical protein PV07_08691 [Cladophialophora immunda]